MNTLTAYEKARAIYQCWILSLYIQTGINNRNLPHDIFTKKLTIKNNGAVVANINGSSKGTPDMNGTADNLSNITRGTCFLAFDEALDEIYGGKPASYSDNPTDSLRAIIYMMRCAFAHNPGSPEWRIKDPKSKKNIKRSFKIEKINFVIDFSQLNGKALDANQHGGFCQLWRLMEYCLDIIKINSTKKANNQE